LRNCLQGKKTELRRFNNMDCPKCGSINKDSSRFCVKCGKILSTSGSNNTTVTSKPKRKDPVIAAVLSVLIVGLGQFYNGQNKKAFIMLFTAIILGLLSYSVGWWILVVISAIDAYRVAK